MAVSDELIQSVSDAIVESQKLIMSAHPGERMNGYALCTDDGLGTLYHVGCTREFCEGLRDSEIRFLPVDWEYGEGQALFDRANELLVESMQQASNFEEHLKVSFEGLVLALERLRSAGLFEKDVVLIVTSTDPGELLEELAADAVRRLNSEHLFDSWKRVMGID